MPSDMNFRPTVVPMAAPASAATAKKKAFAPSTCPVDSAPARPEAELIRINGGDKIAAFLGVHHPNGRRRLNRLVRIEAIVYRHD